MNEACYPSLCAKCIACELICAVTEKKITVYYTFVPCAVQIITDVKLHFQHACVSYLLLPQGQSQNWLRFHQNFSFAQMFSKQSACPGSYRFWDFFFISLVWKVDQMLSLLAIKVWSNMHYSENVWTVTINFLHWDAYSYLTDSVFLTVYKHKVNTWAKCAAFTK